MEEYDTIYVGFPIWWYVAPTIINTFLESYDLSEKAVVIFATSGGSGFGNTIEVLQDSCPGAMLVKSAVFPSGITREELSVWVRALGLDRR